MACGRCLLCNRLAAGCISTVTYAGKKKTTAKWWEIEEEKANHHRKVKSKCPIAMLLLTVMECNANEGMSVKMS